MKGQGWNPAKSKVKVEGFTLKLASTKSILERVLVELKGKRITGPSH